MLDNILLLTDSYKTSHWKQYPEGTKVVYSYLESRGGKFDNTVFFGLQYFLEKYLAGVVVTQEKIDEAEEVIFAHMGPGIFNKEGWQYILEKHGGRLPIAIKAVDEGLAVQTSNALMFMYNTDEEVPWLVNYLETLLLQLWYPITVATLSRECKKLIRDSMVRTGDYQNLEEMAGALDFKLHDFGFRGVSSVESAGLGGAAHLVNFKGTDTMAGIMMTKKYYSAGIAGFSIPASEHSTITSWGKENERDALKNMLIKYPDGVVACVSDSYDIDACTKELWPSLKEDIEKRNGTLVIRPDSGDIKMTLQVVLNNLWRAFGGRVTADGYKILNDKVRVIQGDGMNYDSLKDLLSYIEMIGFSVENLAFGMGGALLQGINRDTQKFAFKCCAIDVNGELRPVFKAPTEIDENGNKHASFKKSKAGLLYVMEENGVYTTGTYLNSADKPNIKDQLRTVFVNGHMVLPTTMDKVRQNAAVI